MTTSLGGSAFLDRVLLAAPQQVVLRVASLAATLGFLWLVVLASGPFHPVLSALLVALAMFAVVLPDSSAPLFLLLGLAGLWTLSVPDTWSAWSLGAAALLLVVHLAGTLACYGPPALTVDRELLTVWVRRAAVMLAVTVLVWLTAGFLGALEPPASAALLVAALALVVLWIAFVISRLVARDGDGPI